MAFPLTSQSYLQSDTIKVIYEVNRKSGISRMYQCDTAVRIALGYTLYCVKHLGKYHAFNSFISSILRVNKVSVCACVGTYQLG